MNRKIFFDLDGTIIDVYKRYYTVIKNYLSDNQLSIDNFDYESFIKLKKSGMKDHMIIKELTLAEIDIEKYVSFKREKLEDSSYLSLDTFIGESPYSDLNKLRNKGYYLEIISQRRNVHNGMTQVEALGLMDYFDKITFLHPRADNSKLNYLRNIATKNDFIIGDSPIEIECAQELSMGCFFVDTGLYGVDCVKKYENYRLCSDYHQAINILLSLD